MKAGGGAQLDVVNILSSHFHRWPKKNRTVRSFLFHRSNVKGLEHVTNTREYNKRQKFGDHLVCHEPKQVQGRLG